MTDAERQRRRRAGLAVTKLVTKPVTKPVTLAAAAGRQEDDDEVAAPEVIERNFLHGLARGNENAKAYNKIARVSALDREAAERISTAIERMIQKWRSVQSTLAKKG